MPGLGSGQLVCRFGFLSTQTKMPALQLPRMAVASDSACITIGDSTVRASHSVTVPCYTSFLASTDALPSISIKDTIVFDQYVGLGPSSGSTEFGALHLVNIIII